MENFNPKDLDSMYTFLTGRDEPHFQWTLKPECKKQKYINKKMKVCGMYGMTNDAHDRSEKMKDRIRLKLLKKEQLRMKEEYERLGINL